MARIQVSRIFVYQCVQVGAFGQQNPLGLGPSFSQAGTNTVYKQPPSA
jgi:hypothetical protein